MMVPPYMFQSHVLRKSCGCQKFRFPDPKKQAIVHQYILSNRINLEIFRCEEMLCHYNRGKKEKQ